MSSKPTWEIQQDPVLGLMMNVSVVTNTVIKLLEANMYVCRSLFYNFHLRELWHVFSALEAPVFPFVKGNLIKLLAQSLTVRSVLMQVLDTSVLHISTCCIYQYVAIMLNMKCFFNTFYCKGTIQIGPKDKCMCTHPYTIKTQIICTFSWLNVPYSLEIFQTSIKSHKNEKER